ncbi:MAG: hypothetical protein KBD31_03245 [Proteobacteria bacterium]|nr:hypothetical protein [Pseudomonadota bacterium]
MFLKNIIIGISLLSMAQASVRQNNPYDATFMGDSLALHREGMTWQHQPYGPSFNVRQNNPYSAIVFVKADEGTPVKIIKKSESDETLEGSMLTDAGISPSNSSRSTSIQTGSSPIAGGSPIKNVKFYDLPSYEESLTSLPPLYSVPPAYSATK